MWAEKKVPRKKRVYTRFDTCHPTPDNLANEESLPDNENIALASIKRRDERVATKDTAPNPNTVAAAALGVGLQLIPQRGHSMCRSPW